MAVSSLTTLATRLPSSGSVPDSLTSAQLNRLQLLLSRFSLARDPTTAAALADPYLGQSIGPVPGYGVSVSSHYYTGHSRSRLPQRLVCKTIWDHSAGVPCFHFYFAPICFVSIDCGYNSVWGHS